MRPGQLSDGTRVDGPVSLRNALLHRREVFVRTVTEKLLTYALGRSVEFSDMPTVRHIVREAARDEYRWSSIVLGVVTSPPFQMRTAPAPQTARRENDHVHHETLAASSDVPAWSRARPWRCRCSTRWCRRSPPREDGRAARAARRFRLCPARRDPESVDARIGNPGFELPTILQPLEPFRDVLTIVSNLARPEELLQDHACTGSWLTGVPPKRTEGSDFLAARSIDQIIAAEIGRDTMFPSLEIATEDFGALLVPA